MSTLRFLVQDIVRHNMMVDGRVKEPDRDRGIWLLSSLIKHDSNPNCKAIVKSNMLLVFALRDLKAGEEVTIGYPGN